MIYLYKRRSSIDVHYLSILCLYTHCIMGFIFWTYHLFYINTVNTECLSMGPTRIVPAYLFIVQPCYVENLDSIDNLCTTKLIPKSYRVLPVIYCYTICQSITLPTMFQDSFYLISESTVINPATLAHKYTNAERMTKKICRRASAILGKVCEWYLPMLRVWLCGNVRQCT